LEAPGAPGHRARRESVRSLLPVSLVGALRWIDSAPRDDLVRVGIDEEELAASFDWQTRKEWIKRPEMSWRPR